ncbi:MAG: hypothetical protein QNL77_02085, partial [Akkermansiaceae bacterium]
PIEFSCPSCQTALRVPAEMAGVSGPCPTCSQTIAAPVHKRWHPWRLQVCSLLSSRILKFLAIIKHQRRNCNRSPNLFPRRPTKLPLNRPPLPHKITAKLLLLGTSLPVGLSVTHPTSNQPEAQQIPDRST